MTARVYPVGGAVRDDLLGVPWHERDWVVVGATPEVLVEKGYRVLLLEKGRAWSDGDFPRTTWNLRRWLWAPRLGLRGIFQMRFLAHATVLTGVGVGGGSLGYANTHPTPPAKFFLAPQWAQLANWQRELEPHYATVRRMLGVTGEPA